MDKFEKKNNALLSPNDTNIVFIRKFHAGFIVNYEGFTRLYTKTLCLRFNHGLYRPWAYDRYIKAQILIGFAHFNDYGSALRYCATAGDCPISPFHGLNGNNRLILNNNCLPNIDPPPFPWRLSRRKQYPLIH